MAGPKRNPIVPRSRRGLRKRIELSNPEIDTNKGLRQRQEAERGERTKKKVQRPGTSQPRTKGITTPNPVPLSNPGLAESEVEAVVTSRSTSLPSAQPHAPLPTYQPNLRHRVTTLPSRLPTYLTTYNSGLERAGYSYNAIV